MVAGPICERLNSRPGLRAQLRRSILAYGEYLGYYGVVKNNPVFHVTAITHRRDAVFQTATISGGRMDCTDTSNLEALRTELNAWRALESVVREPIAAKNVFAVDGDVNIFDDKQMEWAFGTRFQPDRDLVVVTGVRSGPLDPSLHGSPAGSRAGYDLTWPLQHASRWDLVTPTPPTYQGKKFASVRAAVEDGPKWFEELMAATGSRDGREIVRELHKLRPEGLDRDDQGKYFLKKK